MTETVYDQLRSTGKKFSDDELISEMEKHALALTVLWREAEDRENHFIVPSEIPGVMKDERYGKNLFVSVYLSDRRGVHISAIVGRRCAGR